MAASRTSRVHTGNGHASAETLPAGAGRRAVSAPGGQAAGPRSSPLPAPGRTLRVHVKNNHASPETFPPTPEGEAVFTITRERFEDAAARYPHVARHLDVFIDWDLDHFERSMRTAEVLVTWDLPTANLAEAAAEPAPDTHHRRRGWSTCAPWTGCRPGSPWSTTAAHTRTRRGEYGLMAVLMLHNRLPAIVGNQRRAHWESLYSTPIGGKDAAGDSASAASAPRSLDAAGRSGCGCSA